MSTSRGPVRVSDLGELPQPSDHTMFSLSTSQDAQVPTKINPVRFAILYRTGHTSNSWGVRVEDTGDAYIYCRDNMKGQKVSLHASGIQHITISPNRWTGPNLTEKQFFNRWHEPNDDIATFKLVFPPWGVRLSAKDRDDFSSIWNKTDIYIEGHHELLTVVSFFIGGDNITVKKQDAFPGFILAELPLRPKKTLVIVAEWTPQAGFKDLIDNSLRRIAITENMRGVLEDRRENPLALCVTGNCGPENSVYMVTFPAILSSSDPEKSKL